MVSSSSTTTTPGIALQVQPRESRGSRAPLLDGDEDDTTPRQDDADDWGGRSRGCSSRCGRALQLIGVCACVLILAGAVYAMVHSGRLILTLHGHAHGPLSGSSSSSKSGGLPARAARRPKRGEAAVVPARSAEDSGGDDDIGDLRQETLEPPEGVQLGRAVAGMHDID